MKSLFFREKTSNVDVEITETIPLLSGDARRSVAQTLLANRVRIVHHATTTVVRSFRSRIRVHNRGTNLRVPTNGRDAKGTL